MVVREQSCARSAAGSTIICSRDMLSTCSAAGDLNPQNAKCQVSESLPRVFYPMSGAADQESLNTASTVPSTVWGPGTLAGRAILALGEATLKGLDRVVDRESRAMQKRLKTIRGVVPHLTTEMYSDLIEFARYDRSVHIEMRNLFASSSPDVYPQYILEAATAIVFHQLAVGFGAAVAVSISMLPGSEARLVMLRMLNSRCSASLPCAIVC